MSDNELIEDLKEKISNMEERLKAIEKEQEETNRPSFNNMVETILVSYFKGKEEKNKNVTTNANSE